MTVISGQILSSVDAWPGMLSELKGVRDSAIWLVSAYLKESALKELGQAIHPSNEVKVLVRWRRDDLICGSSDLSAYQYAAGRGWSFLARADLHAKVYRFGNSSIYLGSANLTNSGFSLLGTNGNAEVIVRVDLNEKNVTLISGLFSGATLITNELYERLAKWLSSVELEDPKKAGGSDDDFPLQAYFKHPSYSPDRPLLVADCFFSSPEQFIGDTTDGIGEIGNAVCHDISLLGYRLDGTPKVDLRDIADRINYVIIVQWLKYVISGMPNQESYFGELTARLHTDLVDDPAPYRSEVKQLLVNLLAWVKRFPICGITVDRPRHSERIRLG